MSLRRNHILPRLILPATALLFAFFSVTRAARRAFATGASSGFQQESRGVYLRGLPNDIIIGKTGVLSLSVEWEPSLFGADQTPETDVEEISPVPLFAKVPGIDGRFYFRPVIQGRGVLRAHAGRFYRDFQVRVCREILLVATVPHVWRNTSGFVSGDLWLLLAGDGPDEDIPIKYSGTLMPEGGPMAGRPFSFSGTGALSPDRGVCLCRLGELMRGYTKADLIAGGKMSLVLEQMSDDVAFSVSWKSQQGFIMPVEVESRTESGWTPSEDDPGDAGSQHQSVYAYSPSILLKTEDGRDVESLTFRDDLAYSLRPTWSGGRVPLEIRVYVGDSGARSYTDHNGLVSFWFNGEKSLKVLVEVSLEEDEVYYREFTLRTTPGGRIFCGLYPIDDSEEFTWDNAGVYLDCRFPTETDITVRAKVRAFNALLSNTNEFVDWETFKVKGAYKIPIASYNGIEGWVSRYAMTRRFVITFNISTKQRPREVTLFMNDNVRKMIKDAGGKIDAVYINDVEFDYENKKQTTLTFK